MLFLTQEAYSGVYYYPNSQPPLEIKCKDGKAQHHIVIKTGRILQLEGDGSDYFRNPELHPFNVDSAVNTTEEGPKKYRCSHRKLTELESRSYRKKAFEACVKIDKEFGCKGWN